MTSLVSLRAHDLFSYEPPFHPANTASPGDLVGVSIWSAVEPIIGILGAVSTTIEPVFQQRRIPKNSRASLI